SEGSAPVSPSMAPAGSPPSDSPKEGDKSLWNRFRVAQVDQGAPASAAAVEKKSAQTSDNKAIRLEEVIVTAQKREERMIDTPQSVSVVSSDDLAKLGATQFRDFANTVPGLSFATNGAGFTVVSLRGVTTGFDLSPTVGIYVDEVPYGSSTAYGAAGALFALDVGLFDLDRIEVLRGPQGTLYGASTIGGLIKYVTKRPDTTSFSGDAQTGVSGTQDGDVNYNVAASINMPVMTDKVAVRASGYESHEGGYIDNVALGQKDVNRSDIYGGRLNVSLTPTDTLAIRIDGFLQDISDGSWATADYTFAGVPLYGSLNQYRRLAEPFGQRFRVVSGSVIYNFGAATLTSISSYQTAQIQTFFDESVGLVPLLRLFGRSYSAVGVAGDTSTEKFVQEVRLTSTGPRVLEWLIGGFYTHETNGGGSHIVLRDLAGEPAPNDLFTYSTPTLYEEHAAFGDLTWHLTSKFDVTGGVRYAQNEQKFTQFGSGLLARSAPTVRSTEDVFTYLANALYHFSDHASGYLCYASGYRSGCPNGPAVNPIAGGFAFPPPFHADQLKSYEVGFK